MRNSCQLLKFPFKIFSNFPSFTLTPSNFLGPYAKFSSHFLQSSRWLFFRISLPPFISFSLSLFFTKFTRCFRTSLLQILRSFSFYCKRFLNAKSFFRNPFFCLTLLVKNSRRRQSAYDRKKTFYKSSQFVRIRSSWIFASKQNCRKWYLLLFKTSGKV